MLSCLHDNRIFSETQTPHHFRELEHAKNLLIHHHEQALPFFDSLHRMDAPHTWKEIEQHEFAVLWVEALYKNGKIDEQSPDLTGSVAFFDSLSLPKPNDEELSFLQAQAHYYLGTEDCFHDRDVEAVSDYVKALSLMRERFPDTDDLEKIRFLGLAYFRLGELLNYYNIQSSAVSVFELAKACFQKVHDTLGVAASIRNIGEAYLSNKDYEKALAKFKEANHLWDFGESLYDPVIGGLYFIHHQYESALTYLERSFLTSGPYSRIDAAAKLAEIYHQVGDVDRENFYTSFYVQNSIREANRSSDKMEIEFISDSVKSENTMPPGNSWKEKGVAVLAIAILGFIAFLAFIIIHNRHRISHIEQHISTMEQIHREETSDKDHQINAISKQLNDTQQQLERKRTHPEIDLDQALAEFFATPVSKKIHKAVDGKDIMTKSVTLYPHLKLSEMDYIELVRTANKCFPDFSSQLLMDYPNLSTADVRHCCLALLGLNDAEIAVLEGITYSGANRRTNRILSVMKANTGLSECVIAYIQSNIIG